MSGTATTHPANTPLGRFGVQTLVNSPAPFIATMPAAGLVNPLTGVTTLGPLTVLVDYIAGLVNHHRRAENEWTVSGELRLDLAPDAAAVITRNPDVPVLGTAHPFGIKSTTSLGVCELTHDGVPIGTGSVHSVHIRQPGVFADPHHRRPPSALPSPTSLAEMMSVRPGTEPAVLYQDACQDLNNDLGIVNGGVAAAGLELVASAALNAGREVPLATASVQVSFLRRLLGGAGSRYEGTALRIGAGSGIADARAVGPDGELAMLARVTAYR